MISPLQTRDSIPLSFFPSVLPSFSLFLFSPSFSFIVLSSPFLLRYLPDVIPLFSSKFTRLPSPPLVRALASIMYVCVCVNARECTLTCVNTCMSRTRLERGVPSLISIRAKCARDRRRKANRLKNLRTERERMRKTDEERKERASDGNETGKGREKKREE